MDLVRPRRGEGSIRLSKFDALVFCCQDRAAAQIFKWLQRSRSSTCIMTLVHHWWRFCGLLPGTAFQ